MKILTKAGYIDSVALFFELSDEQLENIRSIKEYPLSTLFFDELSISKGDNAHIYHLCNNGTLLNIQEYIKNLLKEYKSVSWWDREIRGFKITRR